MKGPVTARRHASERKKTRNGQASRFEQWWIVKDNPAHVPRISRSVSVIVQCVMLSLSPSTKSGYGTYRSGDRLSMSGSGTKHFSSPRCVHIGPNNPASCILINLDRVFLPWRQIGQRMKQATHSYHFVPWLRIREVLPPILLPLTWRAASYVHCYPRIVSDFPFHSMTFETGGIEGLRPQTLRHLAWQPSAPVSQTLQPSYLSRSVEATA
jgi:hypothetical protein